MSLASASPHIISTHHSGPAPQRAQGSLTRRTAPTEVGQGLPHSAVWPRLAAHLLLEQRYAPAASIPHVYPLLGLSKCVWHACLRSSLQKHESFDAATDRTQPPCYSARIPVRNRRGLAPPSSYTDTRRTPTAWRRAEYGSQHTPCTKSTSITRHKLIRRSLNGYVEHTAPPLCRPARIPQALPQGESSVEASPAAISHPASLVDP